MHTAVTTVTPDTLVSAADQAMRVRRMRHLPVVTEPHTLVGVLTDRDLRQAEASEASPLAEHELTSLLDQLHVRDIMTREVVIVRSTTPLEEAGQIFLQKKCGGRGHAAPARDWLSPRGREGQSGRDDYQN